MSEPIQLNDSEILLEVGRPRYHLRLRLQNKQMECRADLSLKTDKSEQDQQVDSDDESQEREDPAISTRLTARTPTSSEMILLLESYGIVQTIDLAALDSFCAAAAEGNAQKDVLLARGVPPVNGSDGWFEMLFKAADAPAEYQENEKGQVDLRTLHTWTEIQPEQKLGTVHPPQKGTAGMTVRGQPIPAEPGKQFLLIAGDGVILKYDRRVAFAVKEGRALLNKQTLSVVDELVIRGDLDLKVGNIDFHGFVEIKGDVPDEFSVKASKGIRITGTVGASRIEAGGPMEIGGMAGREKGQIICKGDFSARYLNQAQVSCFGNVSVTQEIRNSQVKATGWIIVERGAIIGGKCVALEGIEAKVLGADSGVRTHLVAGRYFPDVDRFDYLRERREEIEQQLGLITAALGPLNQVKKLHKALEQASELRLSILNQQWEKLEQEKDQVNAEIASSSHQIFSSRNPKINAIKTIKEGVVVCLGQSSEKFTRERSGPLTLIENTREGGLRHLSLSPLNQSAILLEKEILKRNTDPALQENLAPKAPRPQPPKS